MQFKELNQIRLSLIRFYVYQCALLAKKAEDENQDASVVLSELIRLSERCKHVLDAEDVEYLQSLAQKLAVSADRDLQAFTKSFSTKTPPTN